MGADISTDGHHAVVRGVERLSGAPVRAPDIRAGAALVVAGLAADGETAISGVHHIDRGYDDLVGRLAASRRRHRTPLTTASVVGMLDLAGAASGQPEQANDDEHRNEDEQCFVPAALMGEQRHDHCSTMSNTVSVVWLSTSKSPA